MPWVIYSTPTCFPSVCCSRRSPTTVCLSLMNENSKTTFFNLESWPIVSVTELYTSVFNSAGVELLLSTSFVTPPTASSPIKEGVAIRSSAAQAKHSNGCCVDWCWDVRLCCRWLISHSAGYTSLPLINCPINPAAELVMHTLQACMLQQSDADMCAHLADLAQQALRLFERKCSTVKIPFPFVFEFPLYAKAERYHAIEGNASKLIWL